MGMQNSWIPKANHQTLESLLIKFQVEKKNLQLKSMLKSHFYLLEKTETAKISIRSSKAPEFSKCNENLILNGFDEVLLDELLYAIQKLPNKQCEHDPFPNWLLKTETARRKNPPSRGAGCALQQECRRGSKTCQLPTTKHFENPSFICHCSPKVTNNSKLHVSFGTCSKENRKSLRKLAPNNNNTRNRITKGFYRYFGSS